MKVNRTGMSLIRQTLKEFWWAIEEEAILHPSATGFILGVLAGAVVFTILMSL